MNLKLTNETLILIIAPCFWLMSILHIIKKDLRLNLMTSGGKSPFSTSLCAVPALYLVLDMRQSVTLRQMPMKDTFLIVSKSSIFRTLFPRLLNIYTVVYTSWCRSVLRWSSDSRISPLVKETAEPETIATTSWSWRCLETYIDSSILLHTTPVHCLWVSVYSCPYFVAAFSLILHWLPESRILASVLLHTTREGKAEDNRTTTTRVDLALSGHIYIYILESRCILHQSTGSWFWRYLKVIALKGKQHSCFKLERC